MIPPTPAIPRFENNSLLLDTTPDFGDDVSLGEMLDPPTPRPIRPAVVVPVITSGPSRGHVNFASSQTFKSSHTSEKTSNTNPNGGKTLCLDDYLPIQEEDEDMLEETTFTGRGERVVESKSYQLARVDSRSVSPVLTRDQPKTDDFYARRLSSSRPASPHLTSSLPIPTAPASRPMGVGAETNRSRFARPSTASTAASTPGLSDDEPSRVHLAWRARPPNASRVAADSSFKSNLAKDGSIKKPSVTQPPTKTRSSVLGRYLAKAAILRRDLAPPSDAASTANVQTAPKDQAFASTPSAEPRQEQSSDSAKMSPPEQPEHPPPVLREDLQETSPSTPTTEAQEQLLETTTVASTLTDALPATTATVHFALSATASKTPPPSSSVLKSSLPIMGSLTPPSLPISATMGTATTPYGIPIPSLVDLSGSDIGTPIDVQSPSDAKQKKSRHQNTEGELMAHDDLTASRSESSSGLVDFFTGFLRGSTSSNPMREPCDAPTRESRPASLHPDPHNEGQGSEGVSGPAVAKEGEENAFQKAIISTSSAKTRDGAGLRQAAPVTKTRRPPIPGYIPLTCPARVPPLSTGTLTARAPQLDRSAARSALQPARTAPVPARAAPPPPRTTLPKPAPSSRPPLASVAASQPTAPVAEKAPRKPPLPSSFARPTASSEFAKAALAKLPPPGKGHSVTAKPVRVKTPERAHNLESRRKVFEAGATSSAVAQTKTSRPTVSLGSNGVAARMPASGRPRPLAKTVPMAGKTPGKASRLRAAQRERFDEAVKERMAEKERERMEREKEREREEEEEYLRRRKETVIWAKPVPEIYKRAGGVQADAD